MTGRMWVESWSPEYGTSYGLGDGDSAWPPSGTSDGEAAAEPIGEVPWAPVAPAVQPAPGGGRDRAGLPRVAFLDGVSRVDARCFLETDDVPAAGLCGSVGTGAILVDGQAPRGASFGPSDIRRAVIFPPGPQVRFPVVSGVLDYRPRPARGDRPEDIRAELEHLREEAEAELARRLAGQGYVVVADGRLRWVEPMEVIGYIKSHHRRYLTPDAEAIVGQLAPGERTPLFALRSRHYSWYLRLARITGSHPWSGIVRCEVSAALPESRVIELADATAAHLPSFASKPFWDTRAPQNLVPIATVERRLWHLLGDRELVLRRIRAAVARAYGNQ